MNTWRLLDTGVLTAAENMALDEVLLECRGRGKSPDTVRFLQFSPPAVLVGYNQSVEQEVRLEYCREQGIHINRRITGGGAILFDESQLGWEIICGKSFFTVGVAGSRFFELLCSPVIKALGSLGIEAAFRPRNDIEVMGRKISGTGGTEEGSAFFFQGTLLVDFDAETMLRALRIPIEKLKDKEIESVKERVTWLSRELVRTPDLEQLKHLLSASFQEAFSITLTEAGLSEEEEKLYGQKKEYFRTTDYIYGTSLKNSEVPALTSIHRSPGGLIKTALVINRPRGMLQSALITGDFFTSPVRIIYDLEAVLKGIPARKEVIEEKIREFFGNRECHIPGITPEDFIQGTHKALDKADVVEYGLSLSEANHLFTVGGTFAAVAGRNPRHILLPYCSKSLSCGYRYEKNCTECGECSVGDAIGLSRKHGMKATTITSFEDLMETLHLFREEGVSSYIGCCCEAFYRKHVEDFEAAQIPAILIDIDDTTCYELGKHKDAYRGEFESQTRVKIPLLEKVLNAVL